MDEYLLSLIQPEQEHIWIGKEPPFAMQALNLLESTNCRVAPIHHTRYQVVWYYRDLLNRAGEMRWRLALDECIRMLGARGMLVLRFEQNLYFSVINLKQFLGRRRGIAVNIEYENIHEGVFTVVFSIERENVELYRDKSWSFVLLAKGDRTDNAVAFLQSVRAIDPDHKHQIIVVGPLRPEYTPFGVTCHSREYREELAELGRKKNDAVALAQRANVAIVHDRYVLDPRFLIGFDSFGYDFDIVAVKQIYASGEDFPFYGAIESRDLVWAQPVHCSDYDSLLPGQFVNGGFMVFKSHMSRAIGFNKLIFWNQAEDLELTQEFMRDSLPPRVNVHSLAVTSAPSTYTIAFRPQKRRLRRVSTSQPIKGLVLSMAVSVFALLPLSLRNRAVSTMRKRGWLYRVKRRLLG
ncbi:hypothetical protein [Devosia submarina]|uniref:hypothetical protein n=1 Tax=Devosia submarina TaxID=1173082 RepID=UPI000D364849|nr:hypothetical protein [Devosia submarina]